MERHIENTMHVDKYLHNHDQVIWVNYAGLPEDRYHAIANKICAGKPSAIISFGIEGGEGAGIKFIDALNMIKRLVNIGDEKTLACHSASTTQRQLGNEELKLADVSADPVRISVGIEHCDDIIADIDQALAATKAP